MKLKDIISELASKLKLKHYNIETMKGQNLKSLHEIYKFMRN